MPYLFIYLFIHLAYARIFLHKLYPISRPNLVRYVITLLSVASLSKIIL
jgi:hypothetical protein